jgi:hypothetical protein
MAAILSSCGGRVLAGDFFWRQLYVRLRACLAIPFSGPDSLAVKSSTGRCGDQNDGAYLNPVLPGGFSDLGASRVGDDFLRDLLHHAVLSRVWGLAFAES